MTQHRVDRPHEHGSDSEGTGDRFRETADAAAGQLQEAADRAHEFAGKVAQEAREYGERAQEAVQNVKPFVEKSLKEQPMTTLAVAAALGFALGALWKR